MKRWLVNITIVAYLAAFSWGILAHTFYYGTGSHPVMYFFVWDMFASWSAYTSRLQVIGEGESGQYYQLAPGPWGEVQPFGTVGRRHYDTVGYTTAKIGLNTLRHTKHEPIERIFVVEEAWAKKFNIPDELWNKRYTEPKQLKKYSQVRHVLSSDGVLLRSYQSWLTTQFQMCVSDNPRLRADLRRYKPFYAFDVSDTSRTTFAPGSSYNSDDQIGLRSGN